MSEITTIKIKKETRKALAELGKKNDTYDDIIRGLIDFYKKNKDSTEGGVKGGKRKTD
jgi:predicted CopG family antitoxin